MLYFLTESADIMPLKKKTRKLFVTNFTSVRLFKNIFDVSRVN